MEEKTAKELVKQLTRIADALEKANNLGNLQEKRKAILDRLEEKNMRLSLRKGIKSAEDISE
jgi:hypothetical protein